MEEASENSEEVSEPMVGPSHGGEEIEISKEPKRNKLQLYTPSSMLDWGQFDAKFFQQIYTQTKFYDPDGNAVPQNNRTTYYSGIANLVLGYNKRFNFGMDLWLKAVNIDTSEGSPFNILTFPGAPFNRTALTSIGPKIKWQPFQRLGNFTLQSSFLFPIAKDPEGRTNGLPYLSTQNFLWWTQIFYTYNINEDWQLFTELDVYWDLDRKFKPKESGYLALPASAFITYFPTKKFTVYANAQFWPNLGENFISSWWTQVGLGAKYQLTKALDLEVSGGKFLAGKGTAGPATTMNLGIRYVKF